MDVTVTTTMATICVWSFPEVAGQVVELQDHRGEGMVHLHDTPSTGLLSQVGETVHDLVTLSVGSVEILMT